jgi:hypothetical protein
MRQTLTAVSARGLALSHHWDFSTIWRISPDFLQMTSAKIVVSYKKNRQTCK